MATTPTSIDGMLAEAEARGSQLPATREQPAQLQEYSAPRKPSLDALEQSSMTVDYWLKVTPDSLKIQVDNKSALFDNLNVTIDMTEVVPTTAIKFGQAPVTYYKTYDGITCSDGATRWQDALEKAARFSASPYDSADIPMTLREDVKDKSGAVIAERGQRIGYSLSTTNKGAFATFRKSLREEGLVDSVVDVKLGQEQKTNKNQQTWGIVTFESEGENAG